MEYTSLYAADPNLLISLFGLFLDIKPNNERKVVDNAGSYTATFFNANYGTNFTNSYRLNYRDHTVNVRAAFELKLANVPSANAFQDIIRGFPKSRYDVTVPINYMRSANSGGVAILYANGTLAINRSAITAVNDYVFIDWIYMGDESLFV